MKQLFALVFLSAVISGCSTADTSDEEPSQFHPLDKEYIIEGCEQLKEEVEERNDENPNHEIVADC